MRHELQEPKNAKTFCLPWVCDGYSVLADELVDFKPQDWLTVASSTKCWKGMSLCCQRSKWQSGHYLFRHTIAPAEPNLLERLHTLHACSASLPSRNSRLPCPCNLLPASYHLPIL